MHTPQDAKQNLAISAMTAFFTFYAYTQSTQWAFNSYLFSIFSYLIMIFSFRCMVYWNTWDY